MANKRNSDLVELTELANGDNITVRDVSDTTNQATGETKRSSWASIKAFLKTYFDTLYQTVMGEDDNYVTDAEKAALHAAGSDTALGTLGTKATPIDADKVVQRNSASSDALVTSTWTQIKAFLKTYFDGIYAESGVNSDITSMTGLDDDGIPVAKVANGDIATDTIWDAAGDTLVGTGANTAKRLAKGAAYQQRRMNSDATDIEWATDILSPWLIDIDVFTTPGDSQTWGNRGVDTGCLYNGKLLSQAGQNDYIEWPVVLSAGTWTFSLLHITYEGGGIYTVSLDGNSEGTIDGYSSAEIKNVLSTITGITVTTPGKVALRLTMATKNASASNYIGLIQHVRLIRTA